MEMRHLGRFEVSVVGLGCNNFGMRIGEKETAAVVDAALEHGINFFDTADVYGATLSEKFLGSALRSRRDEAVIATKFGNMLSERVGDEMKPIEGSGGASKRWIVQAIEGSLKRLGTDRIDLYQLHLPAGDVPFDETLEALNDLVEQGKVLEIGCSNFSGDQIDETMKISANKGWAAWVTAQNHYNLLHREVETDVLPACERNGLKMLPYFPLASGLLTGKYQRGEEPPAGTRLAAAPENRRASIFTDRNFDIVDQLSAFAEQRGHSLLDLAISWLAARPTVASVIAGATKPEQVAANVAAVTWTLEQKEIEEIDRITSG
ncbi:MAG: aldo/keto reductase [Actinobacteria bacterium]|nr:aldo/keto reductase [Actinomycetota bacterium]